MRRNRRERGFTLVELMVSMTLTAILVGLVFTIFVQTSSALRTQTQISELQQALVAAEAVIGRDVRQAGLAAPTGVVAPWDGLTHWGVEVDNERDAPDQLRVLAADPRIQARILAIDPTTSTITVDDATGIDTGTVLLLSDPEPVDPAVRPPPPARYAACLVRVESVVDASVSLESAPPWGQPALGHCGGVGNVDAMAFGARLHAYRIDPARPALGVLQRSRTAGVEDDWEDLGVGFTDLQIATRWLQPGDLDDTLDDDDDPERDWFSGEAQEALTAPRAGALPPATPLELTFSVVVRTTREVAGVVSARTPSLVDEAAPDHNPVGDRAAVELEGVADAARPEALRGERVYRWTTVRVDLRNLGVGL